MLRRFVGAMAAALLAIWSDAGARAIMLGATLFFCLFFPQPYLAELVRDAPIAVVDQDGSPLSRDLVRRIDATDSLAVLHVADMPAAKALFLERQAYGIVIVPADFERDLLAGRSAPIAAYTDGSYFVLNSAMATALGNVARSLGSEVQMGRLVASGLDATTAAAIVAPLTLTAVPLFNPQGGYASFLLPAVFVLILQQTLLMGIGTLKAGHPPVSTIATAAEAVVYVGLYCLWAAVAFLLLLPWLYGVPRIGSSGSMFLVTVPFLAATTALGFALARLVPSKEGVMFFLVVLSMPLFLVSGISWPIESIPLTLRWLSLLVPSTTAIPAIVRLNQMGADLSAVTGTIWLQLGLVLAYAALAVLAGELRQRKV